MSPNQKQVLRSSENVAKKASSHRDVKRKIKSGYSSHHHHIALHSPSNQHHRHYRPQYPHQHSHPFGYYHHGQHQYYQHQHHHQAYHQPHSRSKEPPRREEKPSPAPPLLSSTPTPTIPSNPTQEQPKPPRSAFMCFKDNKKKEIMEKEGISKDNDDLLKVFATAWRKLSEKDKAYWDEEARNDKVRYVQEKAEYTGPWNVPKRRAKKHPEAPKRPMSAFLKFSKTRRKQVKEQNPDVSNTDVSRLLGEIWRNASDAEKAPYVEAELIERNKYKEVMRKWREEQAQLDAASRTTHETTAQIFRHNQHHQHHQQQQQQQQQQQHKSATQSQQYTSAFDRYRDNAPTIGAHFEHFSYDPLMKEESSERSAFHPQMPNQYHRPHQLYEYLSPDTHHQSSWPDLSLQHSMDPDSDPLPVVPRMPPSLQMPKEEYIGGQQSHRSSIYFPDTSSNFSRYP